MSVFSTISGIMSIVTFLMSVFSIVFSIIFKNRYKDRFIIIEQLISYLSNNINTTRDRRRFNRNLKTLTEMNKDIYSDRIKLKYLNEEVPNTNRYFAPLYDQ